MKISRPPFIVKVCGVTTREDAQAALDAGANALGFNFYPKSPRYLSAHKAAEIIDGLKGDYLRVGVFVHPTVDQLEDLTPSLDVLQIHGDGPFAQHLLPVWRAVPATAKPPENASADAWLIDSFTPEFGGSGRTFDWSLAAAFPFPIIVAGGLDGNNVADAIRVTSPWGVDSCSRLESSPGKKDHARMAAFVSNSLAAFHARQTVKI